MLGINSKTITDGKATQTLSLNSFDQLVQTFIGTEKLRNVDFDRLKSSLGGVKMFLVYLLTKLKASERVSDFRISSSECAFDDECCNLLQAMIPYVGEVSGLYLRCVNE